jgi:hypothetical protein
MRLRGNVFTESLPRSGLHNPVVPLLGLVLRGVYRALPGTAFTCHNTIQSVPGVLRMTDIITSQNIDLPFRDILYITSNRWSRDSSVGVGTRLRAGYSGTDSRLGQKCSVLRPGRLYGPPSPLLNVYQRLFTRGNSVRVMNITTPLHLVPRSGTAGRMTS